MTNTHVWKCSCNLRREAVRNACKLTPSTSEYDIASEDLAQFDVTSAKGVTNESHDILGKIRVGGLRAHMHDEIIKNTPEK